MGLERDRGRVRTATGGKIIGIGPPAGCKAVGVVVLLSAFSVVGDASKASAGEPEPTRTATQTFEPVRATPDELAFTFDGVESSRIIDAKVRLSASRHRVRKILRRYESTRQRRRAQRRIRRSLHPPIRFEEVRTAAESDTELLVERDYVVRTGEVRVTTGSSLALNGQAPDSRSAALSWGTVPADTSRLEIYRDSRLIDKLSPSARTYTDHLLWASSSYTYDLLAIGASGQRIAIGTHVVQTPAQQGGFPRPYAASSPWNTPIPSPTVDPRSREIVNFSLAPFAGRANLSTSNAWGLGLAYADRNSKLYDPIKCAAATRNWHSCQVRVAGRIPAYAQPSSGSDGKMTVVDPGAGKELDFWRAVYSSGTWSGSARFSSSITGSGFNCAPRQRCGGPNAAGNNGLAGVVRPEEIAQGHIDHALQLSGISGYVRKGVIACPATNTDGNSTDLRAIPEGARIQLDPTFDVASQSWPQWLKVIARALQEYGAIVDDKGGSLSVMAESNKNRGYDAWAKAGIGPSESRNLAALPWNRMRVLKITEC